MKIHSLCHDISFHPPVSSFFSVSFKKEKQSRKKVSTNLHIHHTKAATCTSDIIHNASVMPLILLIDAMLLCHVNALVCKRLQSKDILIYII